MRLDVVVVGEANLDLVLYGLPEDLPLERELLASGMRLTLGGSPAITAHNLAALGCRTGLISAMAEDAFAALCRGELEAAGVDLSRAVAIGEAVGTGVSVLLPQAGGRRTLTYPGATEQLRFADLDFEYITSARHLHLASYFLQRGLRADVPRLLARCKEAGMTTSLDTNDDPAGEWPAEMLELLRHVDILMPNEQEACRLAHVRELGSAIEVLRERVPVLAIKRGRRGAVGCRDGACVEAAAVAVEAIDAVGAGDSFNAGFLHGFVQGWGLERCLRLGNLAGAYSTTGEGGTRAFQDGAGVERMLRAMEGAESVRGERG